MAEIMTIVVSRLSAHPKTPLCKGKLAAHNPKASLVQREVAIEMSRRDCQYKL